MRPDLDAAYGRAIATIAAANDAVLRSSTAEDIDYSAAIRQAVRSVVERHVTPEQKAACDDDLRLRQASRKEAGVDFLVATIDRELLLTDRQRRQIAESLSAHWDDRWCDALECPRVADGHSQDPGSARDGLSERDAAGDLAPHPEVHESALGRQHRPWRRPGPGAGARWGREGEPSGRAAPGQAGAFRGREGAEGQDP